MKDIRTIKDDGRYQWTMHSKFKLLQYGLGPSLIKRTIRFPDRIEVGIAPHTVAVMRRKDTKSRKQELWVMYQKKSRIKNQNSKVFGGIIIISAWIYPGVSPKGKEMIIPDEVLMELEKLKG